MKSLTRCVHIFPRFNNNHLIEDIRRKHDNLHGCIEPHLTLVFPFESSLDGSLLKDEIEKIMKDEKSISITAHRFEAVDSHGYYLFLTIESGLERLKELHYKLHGGILSEHQSPWTKDGSFMPHITVGRFHNREDLDRAFEEIKNLEFEFKTIVNQLFIEIIGENKTSIIENTVEFGKEKVRDEIGSGLKQK